MLDVTELVTILSRNLSVLEQQTRDVDHDAALRPLFEGASHLNWLLGHLAVSRDAMLAALDRPAYATDPRMERYRRGATPPSAERAVPTDELLELLHAQQQALASGLAESSEILPSPRGEGDGTVGDWLSFLVWHESYHVGQATLYRRAAGLASRLP